MSATVIGKFDSLALLQDETVDYLIHDLCRGKALTESALLGGCEFYPISREGFLIAAPFLETSPQLACFHVERSNFYLKGYGIYTGGMLCLCDPARVTPEALIKEFGFYGELTALSEAANDLEGCLAREHSRISQAKNPPPRLAAGS